MPITNCLQPALTPPEREVVKAYGDWTPFMHAFGLKPFNREDAKEGMGILKAFVHEDKEEKAAEKDDTK